MDKHNNRTFAKFVVMHIEATDIYRLPAWRSLILFCHRFRTKLCRFFYYSLSSLHLRDNAARALR